MPIYEFYCRDCHTLFNFFSSKVDTEVAPPCPKCEIERLERRPARFAALTRGDRSEADQGEEELFPDFDEASLERAMESLSGEFEGLENEEDPRQMAEFFRRFGDATGMKLGPRMEEMLGRLEAGEDPDRLEEELGADLGDDDAALSEWFQVKKSAQALRTRRPKQDDNLYFL
ncbi:MAG: zinc ribbon domain-containing protein [Thermoanaerobaculia bacterium]|nr:zinc ribbon domain-containing protein [Thermoanaerobaculia bacterium]